MTKKRWALLFIPAGEFVKIYCHGDSQHMVFGHYYLSSAHYSGDDRNFIDYTMVLDEKPSVEYFLSTENMWRDLIADEDVLSYSEFEVMEYPHD